ncbi:DUF3489 domain-containing protein [Sphingomonas sp. M1-B02]|uniref:DUF3489 domain-containing protein n=1 Tax=Sphingomonas sp. M1-B02 TaxID=3114300 RepID=UPI00223F079B|nr:DUF3489 domain-containing protein [Sphingomonas sp. S6-11]UZK67308.1 DUF3489 domain-containing protein [Sphingomonas sp. S6-11]
MPKLSDTHLILLSAAAARDSKSLFPLPATLLDAGPPASKAIDALIKRGLVEERATSDNQLVRRIDGDLCFGVFITAAGEKAIDDGVDKGEQAGALPSPASPTPERATKSASVIALLQRGDGATLAELIAATDWLPHTTRAALTGLRKKGHIIERSKRGDTTCYRITVA